MSVIDKEKAKWMTEDGNSLSSFSEEEIVRMLEKMNKDFKYYTTMIDQNTCIKENFSIPDFKKDTKFWIVKNMRRSMLLK